MNDLSGIGKMLILFGSIMLIFGILLVFANKIPYFGKLPGDIHVQRKNFTFYFPFATSIMLSIILSLIFWLFRHK